MRILRLSFKNIASFRSDKLFTIDFTTSPLSQQSLFLITGSTGAGKSTILDAITVALYNKYSREKSTDNFLSSLASNAIIEIEYEKDGTEYRNVWKIKRSRDKLDGALQQAEMQLSLVKTNEILSSKKIKEVTQMTTQILGLDFEQFTKTIILPQGDFANFLHADDKVKIDLFEKITDTKKYREFSQFVFLRNKKEEETLNKIFETIGNFQPLNQEDEQNLHNEIRQLESKIDYQKTEIGNLLAKQQLLNTISDVTFKIQSIESQVKDLKSQKEHFDTVENSLLRAENANEILSIIQEIQQHSTKLEETKSELQKIQNNKIELEIVCTHSTQEREKLQESNDTLTQLVAQLYEKLPNFREIIGRIQTLKGSIDREEKVSSSYLEEYNNNEQTIQQLTESIAHESSKKVEIEQQLQNLSYLETALAHIEQLKSFQKDSHRIETDSKEIQQFIERNTSEIKEKLEEIQENEMRIRENESKKISHTIYADSTMFEYQHLKEYCSFYEIVLSKKSEVNAIEDSIQLLETSLQSSKDNYTKTHREFISATEEFSSISHELSTVQLEVKLQEYRTELINGQPCPLCGSLEHSYSDNHLASDESLLLKIESLQEKYSSLESSKTVLQRLLHNEEQLQQQYIETIEENRRKILSISEEIQDGTVALQQFPFPQNEETLTTIKVEISARDNNKFHQFQIDSDEALNKRNSIEITKLQVAIHNYRDQLVNKTKELSQITTSILEIKQQYQFSTELSTEAFIKEVETNHNEYTSRKDSLHTLRQSIAVSTSKKDSLQVENVKLLQKIAELNNQILEYKSALSLATEEKLSNFGQDDIEMQHQKAHKELQISFSHSKVVEKQHQANLDALTAVKNELSNIQKAITLYIEPTIEELVKKKSLLFTNYNFISDDEIYSAAMDETSIQTTKNEVNTFRLNLANLEYDLQQKTSDLQLIILSKPSETINELANLLNQCEILQAESTQELGAKNLLYQQNEDRKVQYSQYKSEYEQQKSVTNRWNKLNAFIGSNDGKKYQRIVQRITLARLLEYTNIHLQEFSNRYSVSLESSENANNNQTLDLLIKDNDNNGKLRQVSTLSGGETFLVSLSMALGIATMISSTIEVESLFLDEGFGTLDSHTLEIVMLALENLQQKGRKIGIISHVEQLKERISTQIVVQALGNGTSTVYVKEN